MDLIFVPKLRKTLEISRSAFFPNFLVEQVTSRLKHRLYKSTFLDSEYTKWRCALCRKRWHTSAAAHKSVSSKCLKISIRQSTFKSAIDNAGDEHGSMVNDVFDIYWNNQGNICHTFIEHNFVLQWLRNYLWNLQFCFIFMFVKPVLFPRLYSRLQFTIKRKKCHSGWQNENLFAQVRYIVCEQVIM